MSHSKKQDPSLVLSDDLSLPLSAVTEKIAFLGRTGGGKTYAAKKLAEQMERAGAQIIVIDPVGKWYGLRLPGRGPGLPIPVFGGQHGDLPLTSSSGVLIADVLVDRRISAVLDTSDLLLSEQIRFCTEFATQFFQRKKTRQSPCHIFIEECQEVVPQNLADKGASEMLQAWQRIWKIGRNYGIGGSLISQRPQEISKRVLNQTGTLFVFGMTSPHERAVVESWLKDNASDTDIKSVLPRLMNGDSHVWSPGYRLSKTARVSPIQTCDNTSTPLHGENYDALPLTEIDSATLREQMLSLIQEAEQSDPKALRRRIAELESECARLATTQRAVEVPALTADDRTSLSDASDRLTMALAMLSDVERKLAARLGPVEPTGSAAPRPVEVTPSGSDAGDCIVDGTKLRRLERKMIVVLQKSPERYFSAEELAIRTLSRLSGTFRTYLSTLRSLGLIDGTNGAMRISTKGRALFISDPDYPYFTLGALRAQARAGERVMIDVLSLPANRDGLSMTALAAACGVAVSGTFRTYVSNLRTIGVIVGKNNALLTLSPELR